MFSIRFFLFRFPERWTHELFTIWLSNIKVNSFLLLLCARACVHCLMITYIKHITWYLFRFICSGFSRVFFVVSCFIRYSVQFAWAQNPFIHLNVIVALFDWELAKQSTIYIFVAIYIFQSTARLHFNQNCLFWYCEQNIFIWFQWINGLFRINCRIIFFLSSASFQSAVRCSFLFPI